jgi:RNA polymerase sigma factor (sigma-70 family)
MSSDLVRGLARWDEQAWRTLVAEYGPKIWAVTRGFRLNDADAADVFQTTLLNLAERLHTLTSPDRISAWLVTTAKNECLQVKRLRRPLPVRWRPEESTDCGPEERVLVEARDRDLWNAFGRLSPRCQQLLRMVAYLPDYGHEQLAKALGIAATSVGQTRARCLYILRLRLGEAR